MFHKFSSETLISGVRKGTESICPSCDENKVVAAVRIYRYGSVDILFCRCMFIRHFSV